MRYPVRCCCQPDTIYGFLDLPGDRAFRDGEKTNVLTGARLSATSFDPSAASSRDPVSNRKAEIELRTIVTIDTRDGTEFRELAVYSDDRPIEFWRDVYGFTEIKPVMQFSTRTLARALRAENELGNRRFLTASAGSAPLSLADAMDLSRRSAASVSRVETMEIKIMVEKIRELTHSSVTLVGITVAGDLMAKIVRNRDEQSVYAFKREPEPQTFMGIEIIEDPAMLPGTFEIVTDGGAYAERVSAIKSREVVAGAGVKPA